MVPRLQLEARVLSIFDAVKAGSRIEDGLVELKADWPEPANTARRLAAHANAARGEPVLWIIGLDETRGLTKPRAVDLAEWWAQVKAHFDEVVPPMTDLVVHTEDGPLQVMLFDTSLGPFVVQNEAYGKTGGGCVEREIPWRDGTAVRSVHRADLVRMLAPVAKLPEIEVLSASASAKTRPAAAPLGQPGDDLRATEHVDWYFYLGMYVIPTVGEFAVLPMHRTRFELSLGDEPFVLIEDTEARYYAPSTTSYGTMGFQSNVDSVSVDATSSEAIIHLPGRVNFRAQLIEPVRKLSSTAQLRLRFTVQPIHSERSVQLVLGLAPVAPERDGTMRWVLDTHNPHPI